MVSLRLYLVYVGDSIYFVGTGILGWLDVFRTGKKVCFNAYEYPFRVPQSWTISVVKLEGTKYGEDFIDIL